MKYFTERYAVYLNETLYVVTIIFLCSGCALTSPSTERLIFQSKQKSTISDPLFSKSSSTSKKDQLSPSFLLYYLNATFRPIIDAELQYAKRTFASYITTEFEKHPELNSDDLIIRNPYYFSISAPVSLLHSPRFSWAMNVGYPVLSTDLTVDLGKKFFATTTLGVGDGEVIIQKKLLDSNDAGIALGGYYRAERRGVEIEGNHTGPSLILGPIIDGLSADRIFYTHTIGPRLNSLIPLNRRSFLHIRIAPGYSITLQQPVLNFGITMQLATE